MSISPPKSSKIFVASQVLGEVIFPRKEIVVTCMLGVFYPEINIWSFQEKLNRYIDMWLKVFLSCISKDKKYWSITQKMEYNIISLTQIMLISFLRLDMTLVNLPQAQKCLIYWSQKNDDHTWKILRKHIILKHTAGA